MYSFKNKTIGLVSEVQEPIKDFKVWFQTPAGMTSSLDQAIRWCEERDLDPDSIIVAVPVAIGNSYNYEIITR